MKSHTLPDNEHKPSCNWQKADCEYKKTHNYCPHPEHACSCLLPKKKWYKLELETTDPRKLTQLINESFDTPFMGLRVFETANPLPECKCHCHSCANFECTVFTNCPHCTGSSQHPKGMVPPEAKKIKHDLLEIDSNYAGYVPIDKAVAFISKVREEARQEAYNKMDEVIGEDEDVMSITNKLATTDAVKDTIHLAQLTRNKLRAEQRKRLSDLKHEK